MFKSNSFIAATTISGYALLGALAYSPATFAQNEAAGVLDEIIVTAQKREQALADIPMSITVLDGDLLERQQADNFQDLVALVPGLSITSSTRGVTRITLRGINTGGVASTVGVYVDDVPFGSSSGLANGAILSGDFDTFDLARIEVLRGPQGTLYGASSLGGVLKYVPNAPSTDGFEGKIQASAESVADADTGFAVTGVVNVPLSDTFALRVSGFSRSDEGFIDSIGNNPIPSLDPLTGLPDPNINIVDGTRVEKGINSVDTSGGRLAALFKPSDRFSLNLVAQVQAIDTGGPDTVDADPATLAPLDSGNVQSRYHEQDTDIDYEIYSATLDWDFGGISLQSITSDSSFEQNFAIDLAIATALTGGPPLSALVTLIFSDPAVRPLSVVQLQTTSTDKFTQEFRLLSDDSDSFEWLLGAYYTEEDSLIQQDILAVEAGTDDLAAGIPSLAIATLVSNFEELAFFANATWYITPRFELSFGARASDNEQVASQVLDGVLVGGLTTFDDAKSSENPFTWSFAPRYELSDTSSIYARVATGYRPGGPNVLPPGAPVGTPGSYDSDSLTSYEVGYKSTGSNGKFSLDIAAYFLDWEDIQLFAQVNGVGLNANGGTAESKGVEFTASFYPSDSLILSINGAYTDAELTQDTDPLVGGMDGDPLSFVPEWSFGLSGGYEWSVMGDSMAYIGGNIAYTGDRPASFSNRDAGGSIRVAESFTTVNLRAGLDTGQWSFELYGKNLSDEKGINSINSAGSLPNGALGLSYIRPRTIGLSVGVTF